MVHQDYPIKTNINITGVFNYRYIPKITTRRIGSQFINTIQSINHSPGKRYADVKDKTRIRDSDWTALHSTALRCAALVFGLDYRID